MLQSEQTIFEDKTPKILVPDVTLFESVIHLRDICGLHTVIMEVLYHTKQSRVTPLKTL
jgi:hypothetical protein